MQKLQEAIDYILSETYLQEVNNNLKWCSHGSNVFDYFEENELEYEFSNSKTRKKILKSYIHQRTQEILDEIKTESPSFLYRAIYAEKIENDEGFFGYYWSARSDTNPYVESRDENEFLLTIQFHDDIVDWIETFKSRMDYCYGSKEKEYFLKNMQVKLVCFEQI